MRGLPPPRRRRFDLDRRRRTTLVRYRDEELELGEVVNFQIPVELDAGRRWLEAGQTLVSVCVCVF